MEEGKGKSLNQNTDISRSVVYIGEKSKKREKCEENLFLLCQLISPENPKSVLPSLRQLLDVTENNFLGIRHFSLFSLIHTYKLDKISAQRMLSIFSFYQEIRKNEMKQPVKISTAKDVQQFIHNRLYGSSVERLYALYLNQANHIIACQLIGQGGINATFTDVRIVLRGALNCLSTSVILVHNHPSGQCHPSEQDFRITEKIKKAAQIIEIKLLDHVIYTHNSYYSFAENGYL